MAHTSLQVSWRGGIMSLNFPAVLGSDQEEGKYHRG
jgi:hypothetical protein